MNTILRIFNLIIRVIYSKILFYVKYCWDVISSPMHAICYILLYTRTFFLFIYQKLAIREYITSSL